MTDQTTLNQLTLFKGAAGIKASQGALVAGLNGGVSRAPFVLQEGTAPPSSPVARPLLWRFNLHSLLCSMNNGTYNQMAVSSLNLSLSTNNDLAVYVGTGGNTMQDSLIPGANVGCFPLLPLRERSRFAFPTPLIRAAII